MSNKLKEIAELRELCGARLDCCNLTAEGSKMLSNGKIVLEFVPRYRDMGVKATREAAYVAAVLNHFDLMVEENRLLWAMMRGYVNSARKVSDDAYAFFKEWDERCAAKEASDE